MKYGSAVNRCWITFRLHLDCLQAPLQFTVFGQREAEQSRAGREILSCTKLTFKLWHTERAAADWLIDCEQDGLSPAPFGHLPPPPCPLQLLPHPCRLPPQEPPSQLPPRGGSGSQQAVSWKSCKEQLPPQSADVPGPSCKAGKRRSQKWARSQYRRWYRPRFGDLLLYPQSVTQ